MSYSKIIIPLNDALEIVSNYNFSKLHDILPEYGIEPFLALFFYGLTYSNKDAFHPFTIKTRRSEGLGEHSDGELMEWDEPMLYLKPQLFLSLANNPSIKNITNPSRLTDFDSHYIKKYRLPHDFKLKPQKEVINFFLYEIYIDRDNPYNEKEINEAKNLVLQEVIKIKEKFHLESIIKTPSEKISKKIKI